MRHTGSTISLTPCMPTSKHAAPPLQKSAAASEFASWNALVPHRRGGFDPERSDVDLLVQFGNAGAADPLGEYFGLKSQLEGVLGRPVDLLVEGTVRNPYVLAGINASRHLVCAA